MRDDSRLEIQELASSIGAHVRDVLQFQQDREPDMPEFAGEVARLLVAIAARVTQVGATNAGVPIDAEGFAALARGIWNRELQRKAPDDIRLRQPPRGAA